MSAPAHPKRSKDGKQRAMSAAARRRFGQEFRERLLEAVPPSGLLHHLGACEASTHGAMPSNTVLHLPSRNLPVYPAPPSCAGSTQKP